MLRVCVVLAALLSLTLAARVVPPQGQGQVIDTTSIAPPDLVSDTPASVDASTTVADVMTTAAADVSTTMADVITTSAADVTTTMTDVISTTAADVTPCAPAADRIRDLQVISTKPDFGDLTEHEQILIYELLAAAEGCTLKNFITAETAQRIFLLAENLPLKYVYTLVSFMARNMEAEGVVVPV